ncbi:10381_t:CDS:2, partial [Ambispora gerdemannii]
RLKILQSHFTLYIPKKRKGDAELLINTTLFRLQKSVLYIVSQVFDDLLTKASLAENRQEFEMLIEQEKSSHAERGIPRIELSDENPQDFEANLPSRICSIYRAYFTPCRQILNYENYRILGVQRILELRELVRHFVIPDLMSIFNRRTDQKFIQNTFLVLDQLKCIGMDASQEFLTDLELLWNLNVRREIRNKIGIFFQWIGFRLNNKRGNAIFGIFILQANMNASTIPPGRYGHCSFTWKNNFYVFGGWDNFTDSNGVNRNPFFYYTTLPITNTNKITWINLSTVDATSVGSAACVVTQSDYLLVLGGILTLKSNDNKVSTQVFDLNKGVWIDWSKLLNAYPGYGVGPKATLISKNFVAVYAGNTGVNEDGKKLPLQFIYFLNMTSLPWTWSTVTKKEDLDAPISRIVITVKGSVWMLGGYFPNSDAANFTNTPTNSNRIYISNRRYQWISPNDSPLPYSVRDGATGIRDNMLYLISYSGNAENPVNIIPLNMQTMKFQSNISFSDGGMKGRTGASFAQFSGSDAVLTYGGCSLSNVVINCGTPFDTIQIFNMTLKSWTTEHNIVTNIPSNNFKLPPINGLDLNAENDESDSNNGDSNKNQNNTQNSGNNNSDTGKSESRTYIWITVFISCIVTGLFCAMVIFLITRYCRRQSAILTKFEITRNRHIEIAVSKDEAESPARQRSNSEHSSLVVETVDRSRSVSDIDININNDDGINTDNLTSRQRQWIRSVLSIPRTSNSHSRDNNERQSKEQPLSTSKRVNIPSITIDHKSKRDDNWERELITDKNQLIVKLIESSVVITSLALPRKNSKHSYQRQETKEDQAMLDKTNHSNDGFRTVPLKRTTSKTAEPETAQQEARNNGNDHVSNVPSVKGKQPQLNCSIPLGNRHILVDTPPATLSTNAPRKLTVGRTQAMEMRDNKPTTTTEIKPMAMTAKIPTTPSQKKYQRPIA